MSRRASQDASGSRRAARTAALEEKVEVRVGNGASNHVVSGRRAVLLLNRPHRHVSSTRLRSLLTLRTVVTALRSSFLFSINLLRCLSVSDVHVYLLVMLTGRCTGM